MFQFPASFCDIALLPIAILLAPLPPEILLYKAFSPMAILQSELLFLPAPIPIPILNAFVLLDNANPPIAIFLPPTLLLYNALGPIAILQYPEVLSFKASLPKAVLY